MIKISVIITVYNRANLLRLALLSLRNQSYLPDELIISDDGSKEDIVASIKDITNTLSFPVKYIRQENKGFRLAKCRNNGARVAENEQLIFLDQDLIHTRNYLSTLHDNYRKAFFLTAYPVRLTEHQTNRLTEQNIQNYSFVNELTEKQLKKIRNQFRKDYLSCWLNRLKIERDKPKLRGGACAINKEDFININGYDENFIGWGNEDDDIRRRLYKYGVRGYNPFYYEFPIHLYHHPYHSGGNRVNKDYTEKRKYEIKEGKFISKRGLRENNEELIFLTLNY